MAGTIVEVGREVKRHHLGERVTLPFVCGCGECAQCRSGNPQICDHQFQPGFTHWGSIAQFVGIERADFNLVELPDEMEFTTAASLGCRFGTAWRALVDQGKLKADDWVAVHGCGGVGLSAIMIAHSFGARIVAVDINRQALVLASEFGATHIIEARSFDNIPAIIKDLTNGGADISMDALGSKSTCQNSLDCLKKKGRHIQVGLMKGEHQVVEVLMEPIIAKELEIIGSHGIQAARYHVILKKIISGDLHPEKLIQSKIHLKKAADVMINMNDFKKPGITIIDEFS